MAQEKRTVLHSHESIETVGSAGWIMAKFGRRQFHPFAIWGAYPLIAITCLSKASGDVKNTNHNPIRK